MNLDDTQKKHVAGWIEEGLRLSDIQKRIEADLGVQMTYLDVRLLVDDLKLMPKDPEPKSPSAPSPADPLPPKDTPAPAAPGKVSVSVDSLARPGAIVSGNVVFSDGKKALWYLDQSGRLGLSPETKDYKPSAADLQDFQQSLQLELQKLGMY